MKFSGKQHEIRSAMEVLKIDEASRKIVGERVRLRGKGAMSCIYYPEVSCYSPRLQFKICRACPRCASYVRKNVLGHIFGYIKSLAKKLMGQMNDPVEFIRGGYPPTDF